MKQLLVFFIMFFVVVTSAGAQDCNRKCCKSGFCEPACKLHCEANKKIFPGGSPIPLPAPPGPGDVDKMLQVGCAAAFELINKYVIASQQPGYAAGSEQLLHRAKNVLIGAGVIPENEFDGVSIRWGKIKKLGQTPDRNLVFITDQWAGSGDVTNVATVLAHEMIHVRQYRRLGTDQFKCKFSREYVRTGGDMETKNELEREAYAFQEKVSPIIVQYIQNHGVEGSDGDGSVQQSSGQATPMCVTTATACAPNPPRPKGSFCHCFTPQTGPLQGTVQ